jgi:hypothetical protein
VPVNSTPPIQPVCRPRKRLAPGAMDLVRVSSGCGGFRFFRLDQQRDLFSGSPQGFLRFLRFLRTFLQAGKRRGTKGGQQPAKGKVLKLINQEI